MAKSNIQTVKIKDNLAKELREMDAHIKEAQEELDETKQEIKKIGLDLLFKLNADSKEPSDSIRLEDDTGATCRVTMTSKYQEANPKVRDFLAEVGKTPEDFVQNGATVKISSKPFFTADGTFQRELFYEWLTQVLKISNDLKIKDPITVDDINTLPRPDFHTKRWEGFTLTQQKQLAEFCPTTVSVTAE